jgi:hypothetical protein
MESVSASHERRGQEVALEEHDSTPGGARSRGPRRPIRSGPSESGGRVATEQRGECTQNTRGNSVLERFLHPQGRSLPVRKQDSTSRMPCLLCRGLLRHCTSALRTSRKLAFLTLEDAPNFGGCHHAYGGKGWPVVQAEPVEEVVRSMNGKDRNGGFWVAPGSLPGFKENPPARIDHCRGDQRRSDSGLGK